MNGVKEIICDYCGKVCFREFQGILRQVDCNCDKTLEQLKRDSNKTIDILGKWADSVKLENFLTEHGMKWRCCIGSIEAESHSIEEAVKQADILVIEAQKLQQTAGEVNDE